MDEHVYEITVRDLTSYPNQAFAATVASGSTTGAVVELAQRHSNGKSIGWVLTRYASYHESESARTVYPGWRRDRAVLIMCVLIAGFLIGLGVGKHTPRDTTRQLPPVPAPVTTTKAAVYDSADRP